VRHELSLLTNVRPFGWLYRHEPIKVKRRPPRLQIEKNAYDMGQHFANGARLKVPQLRDTNARHGKALRQMRAHGFHPLAQAGTEPAQGRTVRRRHSLAWMGDDHHAVPLGQPRISRHKLDKDLQLLTNLTDVQGRRFKPDRGEAPDPLIR